MPFEQIPYTNFHGTNQDWMIQQIKQMIADWASYRENLDAAWAAYQSNLTGEWTDYQENINSWRQALDAAFTELHTYVHDYFDNLDVQEEINNKLDQMVEDGTLDSILLPYFNAYKADIDGVISTQNQTINNQNTKINVLEAEMNAFIQDHPATTGEKDAELVDIRVGYTGTIYPTAGDAVRDQIDSIHNDLDVINDVLNLEKQTATIVDGYNENNSTLANPSYYAPFIYTSNRYDFSNKYLYSISLHITTAGILSVGTVDKDKVTVGQVFDRSNLKIKEIITISETGYQTLNLTNNFLIKDTEYLFIGTNTDTCAWYYGPNGNDKDFTYVNGTSQVLTSSGSSLGITVVALEQTDTSLRNKLDSIYKNKSISILGDSISTFAGYIPAGNATYYPSATVQSVSDTWWKKLIDALHMNLEINNSWSGSRVTTTAGDEPAGCMTRCENLGESPDVIIVWMGINDFNAEVTLGTYDGKSSIPSDTTTFREAYAIMLNKILTKYQTSEVWVCTLPQCERNAGPGFPEVNGNGVALLEFNNAIRELADAFGVRVLEHDKCGLTYQNMPVYNPDNLHPNKDGHSLIANNDIRQLDNTIGIRY